MKLLLNSPFWYILLCIAIGVLGAFLLYRKDKSLSELSLVWKRILAVLRFGSIFFLAFLLLEPLLEYTKEKVEKPIIVLAYDNSESIAFSSDSSDISNGIESGFQEITNVLNESYEVVTYSFGDQMKEDPTYDFKDKQTNISSFFSEIQERYYNRNLGGIVWASDGIFNAGSNPLFEVKKLKNVPVYSIALGDTTPKKDIVIDQVSHNRLAYKGNKFPVVVQVKAEQCKGSKIKVEVLKRGKALAQQQVVFKEDVSVQSVSFEMEAEGNGLQQYEVRVSAVDGEFSTLNNQKSFFVDVLESKQKILVLTNSPHPDVNAIKSGLESNENYEVKTELISSFTGDVKEYSLLVLFNLPSVTQSLSSFESKGVPVLFVLGNQSDIKAYNALKKGVMITKVNGYTEAQAYVNSNFSLFTMSPELASFSSSLTPLQVPFSGNYQLSNSTETALYQRIGPAKTTYPLLAFNKNGEAKTGVIVGEGIWRWKLQDYSLNGSDDLFNELITQSAQYLVSKEDKSRFRVFGDDAYNENERITFEAEVYNKSYELVNSSEVKMKIVNEQKEEFVYSFSKAADRYALNAGILPPGNYSYVAQTTLNGNVLKRTGEFLVNEIKVEQNNSVANHQLLYNISDVTGGQLFSMNSMSEIGETLKNKEDLVEVIYQEKEVDDLINLRAIFFLLLLLLGVEWYVRKRNGGY